MLRHRSDEPQQLREAVWERGSSTLDAAEVETRLLDARQADCDWRHARAERFRTVLRGLQTAFEAVLAVGGIAGVAVGLALLATGLGIGVGRSLGMGAQARRWVHTAETLSVFFWIILGSLVAVGATAILVDAGIRQLGKRAGIDLGERPGPAGDVPEEN